jgi:hypothetical protein
MIDTLFSWTYSHPTQINLKIHLKIDENSNKKTIKLNINDNNYYLYIHFYNYLPDFKLNKNLYIFIKK